MNSYEKDRGVGVLLLTTHPMRMRILSAWSESKDLSARQARESLLRSIATKDLSPHPMRMRILSECIESKDLFSHPTSESVLAPFSLHGSRARPPWRGTFLLFVCSRRRIIGAHMEFPRIHNA